MSPTHTALWRMFFAVELPDELKTRFAGHIARLREAAPDVRASWERPDKIHITVKFIGEVEEARVSDLSRAAGRATAGINPFALTIKGEGAFPPRGIPRVIWLGVEDESGSLAQVQQRLEVECAALRFKRETRAFHPHLTVARLRVPAGAKKLAALHRETTFEPVSFRVDELVVMRSELAPGGSRYTSLSRHRFGGA